MAEQLSWFQRHEVKIITKLQWLGSRYDKNREINQKTHRYVIYRRHIHTEVHLFKKYIWNHEISSTSSSAIMQKNGVKASTGLLSLLSSCPVESDTEQKTCSFALLRFRGRMWWRICKGEDQGKEGHYP